MDTQDLTPYFESILDTINEGLLLIGRDGKILMVNKAMEELIGYSTEHVVGRPCTLLRCDACERVLRKDGGWWCTLFQHGKEIKRHCQIMKKDGAFISVLKNASVLKDENGKLIGAVETITDISRMERMDLERVQLALQLGADEGFQGMIGKSSGMQRLFRVVAKAAESDAPVIISGESGTGKELVARAIHQLSKRREGPFIEFNCAALNEGLFESELFGHVKGAFTGAHRHRTGRLEAAHEGTLFLDEIGDMPLQMQVKLLRVLETMKIERVGDHSSIEVDIRVISATNRNLEELIAQRGFRDDLYFRINVIPIHIAPLRDRLEDLPPLVNAFIQQLNHLTAKGISALTHDAMEALLEYDWPGNVRELKSALQYAFVLGEGRMIDIDQLPPRVAQRRIRVEAPPSSWTKRDQAKRSALMDALKRSDGNQSEAARLLGVSRGTIWNRMKRYGVDLRKGLA